MNLNFYRLNKIENYLVLEITQEINDIDFFLNCVAEIIKKDKIDLLHIKNLTLSTQNFVKISEFLKQICLVLNSVFIIEDRIDVANATSPDGIFLPQNGFLVATARQFWGNDKILGVEFLNNHDEKIFENEKIDYFIIQDEKFLSKGFLKNKICFLKKEIKPCQVGNLVYLFHTTQ